MEIKKVSLENIIAILFLIIAGLIFWVISSLNINIFDFDFWQYNTKYLTVFFVGVLFINSSILIFLRRKIGWSLGSMALIIMQILMLNKSIAVGIFNFENESNPIGYIVAFLIYLILFIFLNSKKLRTKNNINNTEVFVSILIGVLIALPFTINFWALFNHLNNLQH